MSYLERESGKNLVENFNDPLLFRLKALLLIFEKACYTRYMKVIRIYTAIFQKARKTYLFVKNGVSDFLNLATSPKCHGGGDNLSKNNEFSNKQCNAGSLRDALASFKTCLFYSRLHLNQIIFATFIKSKHNY